MLKFGSESSLGAKGIMQPIEYFTPSINQSLDCDDAEHAVSGMMLIALSTILIAGAKMELST